MPGRKSKSDTSVARFVPFEEENAATRAAPEAIPDAAPAPPPAPIVGIPIPGAFEATRPATRPMSASNSTPMPPGGAQDTPSDKGKDREGGGGHPKEGQAVSIEELQLPKSIITRLAKGVLPPNTQIQANAILAMSKSATVFINHLANAANELTQQQSKKTIMPSDVFRALDDIEFGFMRDRVEAEFAKFNEVQTSKRSNYRKKVAAAKKATKGDGTGADTSMAGTDADMTMGDTTMGSVGESSSGGQHHQSKKARTGDNSRMDVDDEGQDASDPETVPDENEDEDEEEAEEEEEEEDEQDGRGNDEERDELEEREDVPDVDEALDNAEDSE